MINFFKGIIIGIAKIIPGVSGSVLAISMGVYSKCVQILNHFYKMKKKEIKYILPIIFGIIIGILGFSIVLQSVYQRYYLLTMLLFTGFIFGEMYKDVYVNLKRDIAFYIFGFLLFLILPLFNISFINIKNNSLLYLTLGAVEAFTMVVPGISGTAILISLNLYDVYLDFMVSLSTPDFWFSGFKYFFLYTFSLIVFGYLTIKLVALLFSKIKCFSSIIRMLMIISVIIMVKDSFSAISDLSDLIIGLIVFFVGLFISCLFKKLLSKKVNCI